MSREDKLKRIPPEAYQVVAWAQELVSEWGTEIADPDDNERLDRLWVALDNYDKWLNEEDLRSLEGPTEGK